MLFLFCNKVIDLRAISKASSRCTSQLMIDSGIFDQGTKESLSKSPKSKRPTKTRIRLLSISSSFTKSLLTASGNNRYAGPAHSTSVPAKTPLAAA